MSLLLAAVALAAPPTPTEADAIRALVEAGHAARGPVFPSPAPGARKLDLSRSGELAILEDTDGEWFAELLERGADLNWALGTLYDRFYMDFGDDYQYLTILLVRDFEVFGAFYSPMANDITGIGYENSTTVETFDTTDTQVEGMIFMNYFGWWTDDRAMSRYVFAQEFMHRWGAFVHVDAEGLEADALLGRDLAHWSFWMDTPNSPMEGNRWVDGGDGTWTTDAGSGSTYSDLDLYLMGLVGPEDVGEQRILVPDESAIDRGTTPIYLAGTADETVAATELTFTLDAITAVEGERVPSSDDSPRSFRMAFLVLALDGDVLDESTLAAVDGVRRQFEEDWEADVGGLADLDTTLGEGTAPTFGEEAADTDEPVEDAVAEEEEAAGCGCTSGAAPAGLAIPGIAAALIRRRRQTQVSTS